MTASADEPGRAGAPKSPRSEGSPAPGGTGARTRYGTGDEAVNEAVNEAIGETPGEAAAGSPDSAPPGGRSAAPAPAPAHSQAPASTAAPAHAPAAPPPRAPLVKPSAEPPPARREKTVLSRGYRALTLGIVSVIFLIAFEATAVGTAMPVAADELHGVSAYAFAFSALFTTSLLGMVVSGQWSDRRGPLPPVATGIGAFAAGLVASGTATSMWIFVLGRALQGVGGGLVIVALYVTVSRAYPERLRPTVMASFAAAWVVPAVVGPLIAGSVTQHLGWRWVFLGIPVLVAVPLAVMMPALRRSASGPPPGGEAARRPDDRRRLRYAVVLAAGAGLLQYAGQRLTLLALLPAVAGAALLVPAALRLLPHGTYRAARGLPAVVLLRGIASGGFVVAESFVPLMLVSQRGLSVTMAGLAMAAGGLTWALGSFTQSRPRLGPYRARLARAGMVLVTCGIAYAPLALAPAVPVWTLAVAMAVGCYGMGLVISSTSVLLLELSAPEEAGKNSAALQMSDSLSNVVLLAVTGAAFALCGGGSVRVGAAGHAAGGAEAAGTEGRPLAFVAVYAASALVCALGVGVAGRLRERH
ncbi:MFS transporter [Streptomyces marispadix]|uniref:MFS transporter n=1 Tax=Streptomyces marispadix TaxID=2922868 RepID=A0ABS9SW78_9ACTN|nr:MFS transporter [Streptomyces marispadix]MCH6160529.1 MFS transporter [Streptomyces marispadix]